MTRDEIEAKIADLQGQLQQLGNQLLSQSPVAGKILGKIEAYREILDSDEKDKPPDA